MSKIIGIGAKKICQSRESSPFSGLTNKFQTIEERWILKRLKTSVSNSNKVVQIVATITVNPRKVR